MQIAPETIPWQSLYKLMIGAIVPRPIGWISTISPEGRANLAPYSFFSPVCPNPPLVLFCPQIRTVDLQPKDTLRNVIASGEFVVNIATQSTAEAMNLTSTDLPAEVDEFAYAGLTALPSVMVKAPRVGESPVNLECRLREIVKIGDEPGAGSIVIGQIVYMHIADEVLYAGDKIDPLRLEAVGRLAGNTFCRTDALFEMPRPQSQIVAPQRDSAG